MKKLIKLSMLTIALSLASCSHFGHCGGKQCDMKESKCKSCCEGKDNSQCPMKDNQKSEEKK